MNREGVRDALTGPVTSICLPFDNDGNIDFDGLRNQIDFDIGAGSTALILTLGNSLYTLLTDVEVEEVTRITVDHARGRAMVVAADRRWATPKTLEFAQYASDLGADVLMVLPPDWGNSCTPETMAEHYAKVAEYIPIMVVTNVFATRGWPFAKEVFERLIESTDRFVAVKDDLVGIFARRLGLLVHEHCAIMSGGWKENHLNALPYGCDGYMSTYMMFKPDITHLYWNAIESMDFKSAAEVISNYDMPFSEFASSVRGGFDAAIHGTLELFGVNGRWRRKPYYSLDDSEMEQLADFFKSLKVL